MGKISKIFLLILGLVPVFLFLNRVASPDNSFDSINYHYFLGQRGWENGYKSEEFFPNAMHNFAPILEMPGYALSQLVGYRLGTLVSLFSLVGLAIVSYQWIKKIDNKLRFGLLAGLLWFSIFNTWEINLQLGTYYNDILGAFLVIWSFYILYCWKSESGFKRLFFSTLLMGIAIWGKMSNLIYVVPYLIWFLKDGIDLIKKNERKRFLILKFGAVVLVLVLPIVLWGVKNYQLSGNPVFPYFNGIFKSKYYPAEASFEMERYGGNTLGEKLLYFYYSFLNPKMLGPVHDLWNDYKLNFYFLAAVFSLIAFKKHRFLSFTFLSAYFLWSWEFGYLRYGLTLEVLGGIITLLTISEILKRIRKNSVKIALGMIIFLTFGWWNKKIVNMSLAYDVGWRPTYFYNRAEYLAEWQNFSKNKIQFENQPKADIYVNCDIPNMSFYSLSDYKNLPVIAIDKRAYGIMTGNQNYRDEVLKRLKTKFNNKEKISFVTIAGSFGLQNTKDDCIQNLKKSGFEIGGTLLEQNFLGYGRQKVALIWGTYNLSK